MTHEDDRWVLSRRRFLAGLAVAATAAVAGCSGDDEEPDAAGGAGTTTTSAGDGGGSGTDLPPSGLDVDPFTLGIASGDPAPDSVVLWTRLAVDPQAADGAGGMPTDDLPVRWELAADDTFETLVASGDATAVAALGHSVHAVADGLEPATAYRYRIRVGEWTSPIGTTRTAPADGAEVAELRFAMASCQDFQAGHYAAWRSIAADEVDLVFFLGDYIYEYAADPDAVRQHEGDKCRTLADYRNRYATYKADADLQAAHASAPFVVTWDDHEVENNYADLVSGVGTPTEEFAEQRAAAYQAWYEHQPVRLDPPTSEDYDITRTLRWGGLLDAVVLDGRQFRSDQPCDASSDSFVDNTECDIEGAGADMLGPAQEAFALGAIDDSTAIWTVIAQQTVMTPLVLGNTTLNVDQWDGYPAARRRLLDHLASSGATDVVVLTGDIHAAAAAVLATDGTNGPATPVAVELVCTSITSEGLAEEVGLDAETLDPSIFGIPFAELLHRGYTRCTVTPTDWAAEYVTVDDVLDPASGTQVAATARIVAGQVALTID
jgi:alkaline phosphatase D